VSLYDELLRIKFPWVEENPLVMGSKQVRDYYFWFTKYSTDQRSVWFKETKLTHDNMSGPWLRRGNAFAMLHS